MHYLTINPTVIYEIRVSLDILYIANNSQDRVAAMKMMSITQNHLVLQSFIFIYRNYLQKLSVTSPNNLIQQQKVYIV